ncbi:MAG: hypothetical protein ACLQKY_11480 [Terracidiphilus sp.]
MIDWFPESGTKGMVYRLALEEGTTNSQAISFDQVALIVAPARRASG